MQSVNKYGTKNRIGLGWITSGAVLTILAATIGLLLVLSNNLPATVAPAAPVSKEQPAPIARDRTLVDIKGSGHYPFGATGFDSLLPHKPATTPAELIGSGHYPFGATGFDSLLPHKPEVVPATVISSGQYPFGATGFDSLLEDQR